MASLSFPSFTFRPRFRLGNRFRVEFDFADLLNTIDYLLDDEPVLRIAKEEAQRCVLQIGSNSEHGCVLVSKKM